MTTTGASAALVRWRRGAVALALAIAVLAWLGWTARLEVLTRISPDEPPRATWTAVLVAGLGVAILLQSGQPTRARVWAGRALTAMIAAVAVVILMGYLTGASSGLDLAAWPGRPSPQTAVSVVALAWAVALLRLERRWIPTVWPLSVLTAAALPLVAVVAHLFGSGGIVSRSTSFGMSYSTGLALALLAAATIAGRPDRDPMARLVARPDRRMKARFVGAFAILPIGVDLGRTMLQAFGAAPDAAWMLSILLVSFILGATVFSTEQRVQDLMIGKLALSREQALTERQRAEAVERYRVLAENSIDVVVHFRDNEPVWISPSIESALGWPRDQWVGADFAPLIHPDDLNAVFTALAEIAEGKAPVTRFRMATNEGDYHWVEGHGKPYFPSEGQSAGVIVALRVIDAQIAAERELRQAHDSAMALALAKSDYVATVSHEIRAPLNAMLGFSELLEARMSFEKRDEAARWSTRIRVEAERMTRLINDLLDLSRLDAGRLRMVATAFPLRAMLDDLIATSRVEAEAKGLRLNAAVDPNVSDWRTGEPDRLHQVLLNLVSNATKFTSEGSIDVEVSSAATETAPGLVRFAVIDTGPGIPGADIDRIMEPFAQVSGSDSDRGSGLGLAISDRIVKALGGDGLSVVSLEGHGSTFHFTISLPESAPHAAGSDPMVGAAGSVSTRTILVVDDNTTNQLLVEAQLKKLGHVCELAADGSEALERLESGRFDMVLMDCNMPVMDGYETTRRIRAAERGTGGHVPILALTASTLGANRDACERAGMDGLLAKPLLLADLARELGRFLGAGESTGSGQKAATGHSGRGTPEAPILDDARIDRLLAELGADALRNVARTFVAEMPRRMVELCRAAAEGDTDAVRRNAHAIRTPSAMLGAAALAERLRAIEESTDSVSRVSEAPLNDLVDATMGRLHARINQFVDQGEAP